MNALGLADAVASRLAAIPGRDVFVGGVPDGALPGRYVVVWCSNGTEEATRMCGSTNVQTPALTVTSVSRKPDGMEAAREAQWASDRVRSLLRDWSPVGAWSLEVAGSLAARRNEQSQAETVFSAVEQFALRSHV